MNKIDTELACWRVWYRLKERGECSKINLMANCGIKEELLTEALGTLQSMGQIEEVDSEVYRLVAEEPRMMQIFPTLE